MKKQLAVAVCSLSLVLAFGACKKKEEKPPMPQTGMPGQQMAPGQPMAPGQMPPGQMAPGQQMPPGHPSTPNMTKGQATVKVPDIVKGKWKAVVLVVEDKGAKKKSEFTVNLGGDLKVPNTGLKISVGDFLPDFKMEGLTITSLTNNPNNPAVNVKILENDKEVFKGWLYSKFPAIHPFEHPKYSVTLKEAVKKG